MVYYLTVFFTEKDSKMAEEKSSSENSVLIREIENLSFEEALQKLEEIVREMESNSAPLEKMISSFEQGSILASACQAKLEALRTKIEILRKDRQNAAYKWMPFGSENGAGKEKTLPVSEDLSAEDGSNEDVPF